MVGFGMTRRACASRIIVMQEPHDDIARVRRCALRWVLILVGVICVAARANAYGTALFANGADGYACYRIPAIVRAPAGALLAFAKARKNSCADFGDVRIVMRRSNDDGKTWGAVETVAENGLLQAGNPAPVVDTRDRRYPKGRVFLIYCTGDASEAAVMRGEGSRRIWFRTSSDEGKTWSQPVEITASVKLPGWHHYATGPGHALQLMHGRYAGRIVVASNHRRTILNRRGTRTLRMTSTARTMVQRGSWVSRWRGREATRARRRRRLMAR